MKISKLIVLWLFTVIMIFNLAFVPWIFISKNERNRNTVRQAGYSWVFSAPIIPAIATSSGYYRKNTLKYEGFPVEFWSVQIDQTKLIIQSIAIICLFTASYFTIILVQKKTE